MVIPRLMTCNNERLLMENSLPLVTLRLWTMSQHSLIKSAYAQDGMSDTEISYRYFSNIRHPTLTYGECVRYLEVIIVTKE